MQRESTNLAKRRYHSETAGTAWELPNANSLPDCGQTSAQSSARVLSSGQRPPIRQTLIVTAHSDARTAPWQRSGRTTTQPKDAHPARFLAPELEASIPYSFRSVDSEIATDRQDPESQFWTHETPSRHAQHSERLAWPP
jgi:hypothetical protein